MASLGMLHCRTCGCDIDREKLTKGKDWFERAKNWNYCKTCWENFTRKRRKAASGEAVRDEDANPGTEEFEDELEFWFEASFDYLKQTARIKPNYLKFQSQYKNFLSQGMRPKGIYYSIRYWYETKSNLSYDQEKARADGGCGIVPYIYNEAVAWWSKKMKEDATICERIEAQIIASIAAKKKVKVIQQKDGSSARQKQRQATELAMIGELEDDED